MGVLPVPQSKESSFKNADALVRYMEYRLQTPRAIITRELFVQLGYLANRKILMNKEHLEKRGKFISLHDHDYADLVSLARARIAQGLIPNNWFEELNNCMNGVA